jgi:hypothetical protein
MPELDPEDWSPERKLEAVQVYGPHKDWRAVERVYGKGMVAKVKRWKAMAEAGDLVAGEPEGGWPEPEPPDFGELPERLPVSDFRALAELVEPRLRHVLEQLERTRDPRDLKEVAIAFRASIETLIRLKAVTPHEEAVGGDVDVGIEAIVRDLSSLDGYSTATLVDELDRRGLYVLAEPPGSGAQKPPVAVKKAPGPPDLEVTGNGQEEPSSGLAGHASEPVPVQKVTRSGAPAPSGGGGRRGPRVRIGGGRRDPALEGLSERDRARLEGYLTSEPDQLGRGRVRRVGSPDDEGA